MTAESVDPQRLIIAIDGPAGVGKTTVGTRVAQALQAVFVDTGVLYRALTVAALERDLPVEDEIRLVELTRTLGVTLEFDRSSGASHVRLDDRDVTSELRSLAVDQHVSLVAAHPAVRVALVDLQRRAVTGRGVVVGRDIGTVIFPDADIKVFLDASEVERVRRRAGQLGNPTDMERVAADLARRDQLDASRAVAPLVPAADAVRIDTDALSEADVVAEILRLVRLREAGRG